MLNTNLQPPRTGRLDVEKKKMVDLCRKMRKLGLQHMCDIKGEGSVQVDSEARAIGDPVELRNWGLVW